LYPCCSTTRGFEMIECKSREDRLYVLATVCKQKGITPNGSTYMSVIQAVCCGKFLLTKAKARELASTLTSAYKQDHWAEILGETQTIIEQTDIIIQRPDITLPKQEKLSLKQQAKLLSNLAKKDTFNGVGRLHLAEIQFELGSLSADQIIGIWQAVYPEQTIEQNGNVLLIYWQGKAEIREQRNLKAIIQPSPIKMSASQDYHIEPELQKDSEPANKEQIICGEATEDTEGCVEEEDLKEA
jgi:hypothetical protein